MTPARAPRTPGGGTAGGRGAGLSAAEPADEQRIRERLGLPGAEGDPDDVRPPALWSAVRWVSSAGVPAAVALRPLVRDRLGGNTEAWAVAAQLLPTFAGTVPELVVTAGAVA